MKNTCRLFSNIYIYMLYFVVGTKFIWNSPSLWEWETDKDYKKLAVKVRNHPKQLKICYPTESYNVASLILSSVFARSHTMISFFKCTCIYSLITFVSHPIEGWHVSIMSGFKAEVLMREFTIQRYSMVLWTTPWKFPNILWRILISGTYKAY